MSGARHALPRLFFPLFATLRLAFSESGRPLTVAVVRCCFVPGRSESANRSLSDKIVREEDPKVLFKEESNHQEVFEKTCPKAESCRVEARPADPYPRSLSGNPAGAD